MKLFRSIRKVYSLTRYSGKEKSSGSFYDLQNDCINGNRIKLEVKLKVGKKYESRSLEIRRRTHSKNEQNEKQETWILYVVKHADYTSYDYFSLSDNFITQLFDDTNSKCTLVFVENILRFKMKNLSEKWRLVEFIRANLEMKSYFCSGILENSPRLTFSTVPIHIFFHHTCLLFISKKTQKVLTHKSIFDFQMLIFNKKQLSIVCKSSEDSSEFWSFHVEKQEKLFNLITESIEIRGLPILLKQQKSIEKKKESEYVQIPSIHSFYTDF